MSMEKFANHIIAVAQENGKSITNLQLQKVMYFVLKDARDYKILDENKLKEIYDEPFQVWAYGPVIKTQYNRFSNFGSSPIIGVFDKDHSLDDLRDTILAYLDMNVFDLVSKSHEVDFWKLNKPIGTFRTNAEYNLGDL